MVLTIAHTTVFFEHDVQMGIPHETVIQIQAEVITNVEELIYFDK